MSKQRTTIYISQELWDKFKDRTENCSQTIEELIRENMEEDESLDPESDSYKMKVVPDEHDKAKTAKGRKQGKEPDPPPRGNRATSVDQLHDRNRRDDGPKRTDDDESGEDETSWYNKPIL